MNINQENHNNLGKHQVPFIDPIVIAEAIENASNKLCKIIEDQSVYHVKSKQKSGPNRVPNNEVIIPSIITLKIFKEISKLVPEINNDEQVKENIKNYTGYIKQLLEKGDEYLQIGDTENAIYFFTEALKLDNDSGVTHNKIAAKCLKYNLLEDGLLFIEKSLQVNPGNIETRRLQKILVQKGIRLRKKEEMN